MQVVDLIMFSLLMSSRQQSSAVSFAVWIILGLIVGFIGSKILNTDSGLLRDCLLGIGGAVVGGFLADLIGKSSGSGLDLYSEIVAVVGALVSMFVYRALIRRRGFVA